MSSHCNALTAETPEGDANGNTHNEAAALHICNTQGTASTSANGTQDPAVTQPADNTHKASAQPAGMQGGAYMVQ